MHAKTKFVTTVLATAFCTAGGVFAADDTQKQSDPSKQTQTQQPSGNTSANPGMENSDAASPPNQSSTNRAATDMKSLDTDKDGSISKAEAAKMQGLVAKFDAADANKDGRLDQAEYAVATASMKQ